MMCRDTITTTNSGCPEMIHGKTGKTVDATDKSAITLYHLFRFEIEAIYSG